MSDEIDNFNSNLAQIIFDSDSLTSANKLSVAEPKETKYDTVGIVVAGIACVLLFIFFLACAFREKLLGEDDDPIHVFRDTRSRSRGLRAKHHRRQCNDNLPQAERHLATDQQSGKREDALQKVYQLC